MNIGWMHPQVVHFVVALAFVGVGARLVSLLPLGEKFKFTNAMAASLIAIAAVASILAAKTGTDAHGPVERVPGARTAVQEHEDAGEWARDWLIGLAVLELGALAFATRGKIGPALKYVAALGGLVTCAAVFEAAEHGGDLVYNYAGGIGLRSGDSADVRHLLVAGLYHEAMKSRDAGNKDQAARLIGELERQMPSDLSVKLLGVESELRDRGDARGTLARLDSLQIPADSTRYVQRAAFLKADAFALAGMPDSARATLEAIKTRFAENPRVQDAVNRALQRLAATPANAAPDTSRAAPSRDGRRAPR